MVRATDYSTYERILHLTIVNYQDVVPGGNGLCNYCRCSGLSPPRHTYYNLVVEIRRAQNRRREDEKGPIDSFS